MGASHDTFCKYPRTPHLFGATGTPDDKRMSTPASDAMLADPSLIVEEKLDGTNVGLHFVTDEDAGEPELLLQCQGHLITSGMHSQYDLLKQWATARQQQFYGVLGDRYLLFGEWLFARHTVAYAALPHYFFEFDIYDKTDRVFLDLSRRLPLVSALGVETVPVLHRGPISRKQLDGLIERSAFESRFEHPGNTQTDDRMEGLYLRTEAGGVVSGRAKRVRPEFVAKINESTHWQQQPMMANQLADGVSIWS